MARWEAGIAGFVAGARSKTLRQWRSRATQTSDAEEAISSGALHWMRTGRDSAWRCWRRQHVEMCTAANHWRARTRSAGWRWLLGELQVAERASRAYGTHRLGLALRKWVRIVAGRLKEERVIGPALDIAFERRRIKGLWFGWNGWLDLTVHATADYKGRNVVLTLLKGSTRKVLACWRLRAKGEARMAWSESRAIKMHAKCGAFRCLEALRDFRVSSTRTNLAMCSALNVVARKGFVSWRCAYVGDRRRRCLASGSLGQLIHRQQADALRGWMDAARQIRAGGRRVRQAGMFFNKTSKSNLGRGLQGWKQRYQDRNNRLSSLRNAALWLLQRTMSNAWCSWRGVCTEGARAQNLVVPGIKAAVLRGLGGGFRSWKESHTQRQLQKDHWDAGIAGFVAGARSKTLRQWRSNATQVRCEAAVASMSAEHWSRKEVFCAWRCWRKQFADMGLADVHLMAYTLIAGWSWFRSEMQARTRVSRVCSALVHQTTSGQVHICFGHWRDLAVGRRGLQPVSYTHLRAHETPEHLVCRLLLEKKKKKRKT
eukprot:TRINITY_DN4270_c0_g3_i1.p1 TRINITY_DN4270_c0_g3~~TRINITY_DN4270_c0_g3_i1.p1  ORF type:complete len:542 (-),score=73.84 TRINITY_DN4270_c0_g3_i1:59-1684(-)